jgi:hypothetical protein
VSTFSNPDPSFAAQADRVYALYQFIGDVRDRRPLRDTDARCVCLNNIMRAANASVATLRLLHWVQQGADGLLIEALGLASPEYVNLVAEDLLRASRLHLLIEAQFQIEALFRAMLTALGRRPGIEGFFRLAEDLLREVKFPEPEATLRILHVPALMRNSMHANGVHYGYRGTDTVEIINGVEFRFEHGRSVQCGSWYHIATALTATVGIIEQLLAMPAVVALPDVPDAHAVQRRSRGGPATLPQG